MPNALKKQRESLILQGRRTRGNVAVLTKVVSFEMGFEGSIGVPWGGRGRTFTIKGTA